MVEQVLQAGAEKVDDQDVVEAFLAKVIDIRNPGWMRSVMLLERGVYVVVVVVVVVVCLRVRCRQW